jgi:predicted Fe-Mo cluster-binding NifX family protein
MTHEPEDLRSPTEIETEPKQGGVMPFIIALLMTMSFSSGKIAITATGSTPESAIDGRFGRAGWYMIYDPADGSWESVDNSSPAAGGAGRDAAEALIDKGIKIVITGQCGPKAMTVLRSTGIKVFHASSCTVGKALEDYEAGRLKQIK